MSRVDDLIDAVEQSLEGLCEEESNLFAFNLSKYPTDIDPDILHLEGMSGYKYRIFANRLMTFPINSSYLEIGSWKGSTAVSSLYDNFDVVQKHWLIDNFSEFSEWTINGETKKEFYRSWKAFIKDQEPNLIDQDCFAINPKEYGIDQVSVYLYDGNHSEEAHKKALTHYYDSMADSFIFLVDDWYMCAKKDNEIIRGTMSAINDLNLKIKYQKEVSGPMTNINPNGVGDYRNWWNGCGIFVLEK